MPQIQLSTKVSPECWELLEKEAKKTKRSKASIVEEALWSFIQNGKNEKREEKEGKKGSKRE